MKKFLVAATLSLCALLPTFVYASAHPHPHPHPYFISPAMLCKNVTRGKEICNKSVGWKVSSGPAYKCKWDSSQKPAKCVTSNDKIGKVF
jgi:hypothetical protein